MFSYLTPITVPHTPRGVRTMSFICGQRDISGQRWRSLQDYLWLQGPWHGMWHGMACGATRHVIHGLASFTPGAGAHLEPKQCYLCIIRADCRCFLAAFGHSAFVLYANCDVLTLANCHTVSTGLLARQCHITRFHYVDAQRMATGAPKSSFE
jgi:hypothetical protein